jgi:hypothetical protein
VMCAPHPSHDDPQPQMLSCEAYQVILCAGSAGEAQRAESCFGNILPANFTWRSFPIEQVAETCALENAWPLLAPGSSAWAALAGAWFASRTLLIALDVQAARVERKPK